MKCRVTRIATAVLSALVLFVVPPSTAQRETVTRTIEFSGTVVDAAGRGVPDAVVVFLEAANDAYVPRPLGPSFPFPVVADHAPVAGPAPLKPAGRTTTRAGGQFRHTLDVQLPAEGALISRWDGGRSHESPVWVAAFSKDGMATAWRRSGPFPVKADRVGPITIQLLPAAHLTVRVRDEAGRPIAKAPVRVFEREILFRLARFEGQRLALPLMFEARTPASGEITFTVPAGLDLSIRLPEHDLFTAGTTVRVGDPIRVNADLPQPSPPLRLAAGETRIVDMALTRFVRVRGRVTQGGRPCANATVWSLSSETKADANGRYRFEERLRVGSSVVGGLSRGLALAEMIPQPATGDDVVVDLQAMDPDGLLVAADRRDVDLFAATYFASVPPASAPEANDAVPDAGAPDAAQKTTATARFDVYGSKRVHLMASPRSDAPTGPLGFHVVRDVSTLEPATLAVPDVTHDASLSVTVRPVGRGTVDGAVYLAVVAVDRYPGVRLFAERLVPTQRGRTRPRMAGPRARTGASR